MMKFLAELRRRNVLRMAGLYLVGAWLVTQVAGTLLPMFGAPDWIARTIVGLLAIGLVPVMLFSWVFELTPEGLKKESEIDRSQSITPQTGVRLQRMTLALGVLALAYFAVDKFVLAPKRQAAEVSAAVAKVQADAQAAVSDASIAVLPFANMSGDPGQGAEGRGELRIVGQRLVGRLAPQTIALGNRAQADVGLTGVDPRQQCPRGGISRGDRQGLLQQREGAGLTLSIALAGERERLQPQLIGPRVDHRGGRDGAEQLELELRHHRGRDLVLHREDVRHRTVVGLRPQLAAVGGADQLRGDAHRVAGLADAAFEHVADVEAFGDLADLDALALEGERRSARNHPQAGNAGQLVQQLLGNAVGEISLTVVDMIGWTTGSVGVMAMVAVPLLPRVFGAVRLARSGPRMGAMLLREGAISTAGCVLIGFGYVAGMSAGPNDPPNTLSVPPPIGYVATAMAVYYLVLGYFAGNQEGAENWIESGKRH